MIETMHSGESFARRRDAEASVPWMRAEDRNLCLEAILMRERCQVGISRRTADTKAGNVSCCADVTKIL